MWYNLICTCYLKMASRKRRMKCSGEQTQVPKRQVSLETFKKWQKTYEKDHLSLTWLCCDEDGSHVSVLWYAVCRTYQVKIVGHRNFSEAWVRGSSNHKTSNIVDHATSEQHKAAMMYHRREQAKSRNEPATSYSAIARSMESSRSMDSAVRERVKKKFELSFVLAKEHIPFTKYPALHELEEKHGGLTLEQRTKTRDSAKTFTHYIHVAESQRKQDQDDLKSSCPFYSVLMDGSTDKGRVEDELFVILSCRKDDWTQEITTFARFLSIVEPKKADADGLIDCLNQALSVMGITDILDRKSVLEASGHPVLIGCGTDGAAVNVSDMRSKLQGALCWLFWGWCYSHRLELACKDAFTSILFSNIDEMLLRLYFLYEKSPKKCRELLDIVEDLKDVFEFPKGGNLPVRAHGSRWINYKRKALLRVVDRYGAYLHHLRVLSEDKSIKSVDRQRLKGYLLKWRQAKMLVGSALYIDVLHPVAILSLTLQNDDLDVVFGIKSILKSHKSLQKLSSLDPSEWPVTKVVLSRMKEQDGGKVY